MNSTRRHDNDRNWSRDEDDDRYASARYRSDERDDSARDRYRVSADRFRGRSSQDEEGYRQQEFGSRGRWPEDRGYDDYRNFQQPSRHSQDDQRHGYQGYGQPQRGGYYSQRNEPDRHGSQSGNYEPGYGSSRGYGNQGASQSQPSYGQGNWHDRNYQGNSPGYEHDRSHSWREDYGSTGQQYRSSAPIHGSHENGSSESPSGFRGQGPKGYKRSDQRIQEDVNDHFTDSSSLDASGIDITVRDGEVTLAGTVNSRACKREAEDLADRISGVKHVQNNLRVQEQGTQGNPGTSGQAAGSNTTSFGTSGASQTSGSTGTTGKTTRTTN